MLCETPARVVARMCVPVDYVCITAHAHISHLRGHPVYRHPPLWMFIPP
jgi:hypothetical protein